MRKVPLIDLAAQNGPLAGELRDAAARVLASSRFVLGNEVASFEREVAAAVGVAHAIGVSSGTDALLAMLLASGVGPGDEVITTPYSFFATVEAVVRAGARPVFADIDPATLLIDPVRVGERIGPSTRALLPVHLFGRVAAVGALARLADEAGIALLEDGAQAIGAPGLGKHARAAGLSFFPSKNLGGFGDGGMVITDDRDFAERIQSLRSHGALQPHRHVTLGGNWRLDELQAALLAVKLPYLGRWTALRRRLAGRYRARLASAPVQLPPDDDDCVWNQFVIRVEPPLRERLVAHLDERGVATAIYYPTPLHLQPALAGLGHHSGDFPNAERASRETLALPIYPELRDDDVDLVTDAIASFFR
jgi:dTDP-4-amino-4,6-dideoxygalactose transaminase